MVLYKTTCKENEQRMLYKKHMLIKNKRGIKHITMTICGGGQGGSEFCD